MSASEPGDGAGLPIQRVERILRIHRALKSGGYYTAKRLSRDLEVHERTIYRDVEFLRDRLGAPLEAAGPQGYHYTDRTFELPDMTLSEGELLAFLVAERVIEGYAGASAPFFRRMRQGLERLSRGLSRKVTVPLEDLYQRRYDFDAGPLRSVRPEVIEAVEEALASGRALFLRYRAVAGEEITERVIEPYHLRLHRGDWYVVARCRLREDLRTFSLSRVHEVRVLEDSYRIPPDFDAETYFQSALSIFTGKQVETVQVWFSPHAARWIVERQWHPSQQVETAEDGSVILTLRVAVTIEVVRWVLAHGHEARVLGPPSLVDKVRREVEAMGRGYCEGAGAGG